MDNNIIIIISIFVTSICVIGFISLMFKYNALWNLYNIVLNVETKDSKFPQQQQIDIDDFDSFEKQLQRKEKEITKNIWHDPNDFPPRIQGSQSSIQVLIHDKEDRYCLGWFWYGTLNYSIFIKGKSCAVNEFIECKRWCKTEDII